MDIDKKILININGIRPADVNVKLNTGENLGLIQSISIDGSVSNFNTVKLTSILEKADVELLQKNTELKVILPNDYKIGYWVKTIFDKIFK